VPAAADEVSAAITRLFGTYAQQFQALSARMAAFHARFCSCCPRVGRPMRPLRRRMRTRCGLPAVQGGRPSVRAAPAV
jgi:hypothetical protein